MRRLSFSDAEDACQYCGNREYDISATMIQCTYCGVVIGRCNGVWVVDSMTIPSTTKRVDKIEQVSGTASRDGPRR